MAVTKIHPIKSTLKKALDYIENPAKTDEKMLVSSFACSYETADIEFELLLSQAMKKDSGCNGQHHRFGKTSQHIEDAAVPCLRGGADIRSNFAYLGIYVIEQAGEVARDAIYQNAFYPFLDDLTNQAKIPPFPRPPM